MGAGELTVLSLRSQLMGIKEGRPFVVRHGSRRQKRRGDGKNDVVGTYFGIEESFMAMRREMGLEGCGASPALSRWLTLHDRARD